MSNCDTACNADNVCEKVGGLLLDMESLWNDYYGEPRSVYIATGNIGIPADADLSGDPTKYSNDQIEYMRGAAVINAQNPKGLFLVGGNNFDQVQIPAYNLVGQEAKFYNGFSQLMANRQVFPVLGQEDFWAAQDTVGAIDVKMANTLIRSFPHLTDAKRYYSVYDAKTKTEFFILSSGRYRDPYTPYSSGFVYANDRLVGDDQYDWFAQRIAATPARNKVVIFTEPFTSLPNSFEGIGGSAGSFAYFDTWDFQSFGVQLIINGHVGNSFHLHRSSVHMVNASAFSRSRMSLRSTTDNSEPPVINSIYGQGGWAVEYFSHQPMGIAATNVVYPAADPNNWIAPKNEFFRMTARADGILCEFVSYDPYAGTAEAVKNSLTVEHSFEIFN